MEPIRVCEHCNCQIESDWNVREQEQKCFAQLVRESKSSRCDVDTPEVKLGTSGVIRWLLGTSSLLTSPIDKVVEACEGSSEEQVLDILEENCVFIKLPTYTEMESEYWSHTAIHHAVKLGSPEIISWILGFKVNSKKIMRICLNLMALEAARGGKLNNLIELVKLGSDLKTNDDDGTSVIEVASRKGYIHIIQWMFNNNFVDKNFQACSIALHKAIVAKHFDIVEYLVENEVDLNEKDTNGKTAIHFAVKIGNISLVQWLVKNGAELFVTNSDNHVLHTALEHGHIDLFKWLLSQGGDVSVKNNKNRSLLHVAASKGYLDLVKFLVHNSNCDINAKDDFGYSVLLLASRSQNIDIIRLLCTHGADIHTKNNYNCTVLHFCHTNLKIVQEFVNLGVDIHAKADGDKSVLFYAAKCGKYEIIKWLLEKGLDVTDLICEYNFSRDTNNEMLLLCLQYITDVNQIFGGQTLLCKCASNLEAVKILIEHKADVNIGSPLLESLKRFEINIEAANYLIDNGADVNFQNYNGETVLYKAVASHNFEFVKKLVGLGVHVNTITKSCQESILIHAILHGHNLPIIKYLVENGANVNAVDGFTKTALIHAAEENNWDVVKFLAQHGADINYQSKSCPPILYNAIQSVEIDLICWLLDHGAEVKTPCIDGDVEDEKKIELIKLLITRGVNVNTIRSSRESILFDYLHNYEMLDYLIKKGINLTNYNSKGESVLHSVLTSKHFKASHNPTHDQMKIVKLLLSAGARVNCTNEERATPLHLAVSDLRYVSIAKALVLSGADINAKDKDDNSILHLTLQGELALWLCGKGADLNARYYRVSVLQSAIKNVPKQNSSLNIVQLLEARDSNRSKLLFESHECVQYYHYMNYLQFLMKSVRDINTKDHHGCSAIHYAVSTNNPNILQLLIESGADILININTVNTVLYEAVSEGSLPIVSYLLNHEKCDMLLEGEHTSENLLSSAVTTNNVGIVKLLLEYGVKVDTYWLYNTFLHLACECGNFEIIELLLQYGANLYETSTKSITAIHLAVRLCKFDVFKYLLDYESTLESRGKFLQLKTHKNETLLHSATKFGTLSNVPTKIVEYLLETNAIPIDCVNNKGNSALHYACSTPLFKVVKLLVDKGANINLKNNTGNTPLHLAAQIGSRNIVKYLCKNGGNARLKNKKGNAPIHIAISHDRTQVFDILVDNISDLYVKNRKGNCGMQLYCSKPTKTLIGNFPSVNVNVINHKKQTPLQLFLKLYPNSEISDFLVTNECINHQDVCGNTVLHRLFMLQNKFNYFCERKLLESGIDLTIQNKDGNTPMHVALKNLDSCNIRSLIPYLPTVNIVNNLGWNILHQAVTRMDLQTVKILFELATDDIIYYAKTKDGKTYLHLAAQNKEHYSDVLKWLVENYESQLHHTDLDGNTVLHTFIESVNTVEFPRYLLCHSSDFLDDNDDDDESKLLRAVIKDRLYLVNYLISKGVDVNIANCNNDTVLHYAACSRANLTIVETLCENGANVNAVNCSLRTALHNALLAEDNASMIYCLVLRFKCDVHLKDYSGKDAYELAPYSESKIWLGKHIFQRRMNKTVSDNQSDTDDDET